MLTYDHYVSASTLADTFDALDAFPGARLIAGGTDLLPWAREGRAGDVHLPALIDVSAIAELGVLSLDGARLAIGAAVPISASEDDLRLVENAQVLGRCAVWFADDQIREQATFGGNIVNASPAGDSLPALLALNAQLLLASRPSAGHIVERRVALADFIVSPGRTVLQDKEILVRIECDAAPGYGCCFEKVGHRRSLVISTVCLAVVVKLDASGETIGDVRISIGAVGPVAERLHDCEAALLGATPDAQRIRDVAKRTVDRVRSRSRQEYRREVLVNFVERGLLEALGRAGARIERLPKETLYA